MSGGAPLTLAGMSQPPLTTPMKRSWNLFWILKKKFGCITSDGMIFYLSFSRWQCRWNQFTLLLSFSPSERKPSPTSQPITQGTKLTAHLPSLSSVSSSLQPRWIVFMWNVWVLWMTCLIPAGQRKAFLLKLFSIHRADWGGSCTNKCIEHWANIKLRISLDWIVLPQKMQHFNG